MYWGFTEQHNNAIFFSVLFSIPLWMILRFLLIFFAAASHRAIYFRGVAIVTPRSLSWDVPLLSSAADIQGFDYSFLSALLHIYPQWRLSATYLLIHFFWGQIDLQPSFASKALKKLSAFLTDFSGSLLFWFSVFLMPVAFPSLLNTFVFPFPLPPSVYKCSWGKGVVLPCSFIICLWAYL